MIRVLVVEDDALLRSALASGLTDDRIEVVDAVGSAQETARVTGAIDVLITDLDLGDGPDGLVIAHALRRRWPELGVIVLTSYEDPRLIGTKLAQLPVGAAYLTKHSITDLAVLREEVVGAAARGTGAERRPPAPSVHLTDTQIETMRLIAEGLTNADIARRRVVTEKSVEITVTRILRALDPADQDLNPRVRITRAYYTLAGTDAPKPRKTS